HLGHPTAINNSGQGGSAQAFLACLQFLALRTNMPAVSPSRLFCALSLLIALYVSSLHAAPYTFTKITDSTGPYNSFIDASINNSGSVALLGALDSGATGISRGNGGPLLTIADTTGPFGGLFRPTINILGEVGFLASNDVGGSAVYRG